MSLNGIKGIAFNPTIPEEDLMEDGSLYNEFVFLRKIGKIPSGKNWDKVSLNFDRHILLELFKNSKKYPLNVFHYSDLENSSPK